MAERMNPEVKAKWIAALRSGDYEQATEVLRKEERFGFSFCCLGVLCDLYRADKGGEWQGQAFVDVTQERAELGSLTMSVRRWAGGDVDLREVFTGDLDDDVLSNLNDCGWSFSEIADAIEAEL